VTIDAPLFNLELTLNCGQVFHWRRDGAGWKGMIGGTLSRVELRGEKLHIDGASPDTVKRYFALDHPLAEIVASFPRDPTMDASLAACHGMRIIRQPRWECLATFITSAQKGVPHITQISHMLRERYGRGGAYPEPAALAALTEEDLRGCALGYRAKNLLRTAQMIATGEVDLEHVATLDDDAARAELMRLAGVGPKVANCVLLFGYERLASFPIDVWIERVLRLFYFARKRRVTAERMRIFAADYFGPFGGYAQQYLFHHARATKTRAVSGSDKQGRKK
jgi:N-glycosylase/DNA lyase